MSTQKMAYHIPVEKQLTININGIRIGGIPGENPTLLIGSIFYHGDKLLLDAKSGEFNREAVKNVVLYALDYARGLGLHFGLDVIFPTARSVDKILPFMSEFEEVVLFLDSPSGEARSRAYSMSRELGITDRVVANGIYVDTPQSELEALRDSGIRNAVILAFDPANPYKSMYPTDRLRLVRELVEKAKELGIENMLVDAVVLDPGSIGISASTIYLVKRELGLPSGCAPANALGPVSKSKFSVEELVSIHGAIAVYLRAMGADFIMYGPVKRIKYVAKPIAVIDGLLGYLVRHQGIRIKGVHPVKTILKTLQQLFTQSS